MCCSKVVVKNGRAPLIFFPLGASVMDEELRERICEKLEALGERVSEKIGEMMSADDEESQEIHKLLRRAELLRELASLPCKTEEAKRKAELLLRIAVVYEVRVKKELGGEGNGV